MITCKLCNKKFKIIHWSHLKRKHNITRQEYIKMFPNAKLLTDELYDSIGQTKEKMIIRHGKVDGLNRWNIYREKQRYTNTVEYFIEKYGEVEGKEKFYNSNRLKGTTLQNCIKRYGKDAGTKFYNDYVNRQRYTNTVEYFIEKYGEVEGKEKFKKCNFLKGHTYESYLYRYDGDVEKALTELSKYYSKMSYYNSTSEISLKLFNKLKDIILNTTNYTKIFYDGYTQEWYFSIKKFGFFKVDFFLKDVGKIIEFYGDYWHCNPKKYKPMDICNFPHNKKQIAKNVWNKDNERISIIKKVPYINDILIVWESDFRNEEKRIIDKCINFLLTE